MKFAFLIALQLVVFSASLAKAEYTMDQMGQMFNSATEPSQDDLKFTSVWSGVFAQPPNQQNGPYTYLTNFTIVDPLSNVTQYYALTLFTNEVSPSAQDLIASVKQQMQTTSVSTANIFPASNSIGTTIGDQAQMLKKITDAQGKVSLIEKTICYNQSGCNSFAFGDPLAYSYFTAYTVVPNGEVGALNLSAILNASF